MRSFNERSGASSSEGGGEFECRVSTYLPNFFLEGGSLIPSGGSSCYMYKYLATSLPFFLHDVIIVLLLIT